VKRIALWLAQLACGIVTGGKHVPTVDDVLGRFCKRCLKKLGPA